MAMPKSTTAKGTTTRPPYKMKSAGTKWGIPPDSSEDSTPGPAPTRATIAEERPKREEHEISEPVSKDVPDTLGDELLPEVAAKGREGSSTVKQTKERKKTLQKSKTIPAGTSKRSSLRSRAHPRRGRKVTTTVDHEWMADDELESGAFDGMSTDDADAKMAQIFRRLG